MFIQHNENPEDLNTIDCTVRAIALALNQSWETTYLGMVVMGFLLHDMPSADYVWGSYLEAQGFRKCIVPTCYPERYTVKDFCKDHPSGVYILALSKHVMTVIDGDYYDTWDSGNRVPLYYWCIER